MPRLINPIEQLSKGDECEWIAHWIPFLSSSRVSTDAVMAQKRLHAPSN